MPLRYNEPTGRVPGINKNIMATKTNDMPLIDATKNADEPKRKELEQLKRVCKDGKICR